MRQLLEIIVIGALLWYFLSLKFFLGVGAGIVIGVEFLNYRKKD